jgi:hypothetical protein
MRTESTLLQSNRAVLTEIRMRNETRFDLAETSRMIILAQEFQRNATELMNMYAVKILNLTLQTTR